MVLSRKMSTTADFGTWKIGAIQPDLFSKCNCKSICEAQVVEDTVFWTEQNAPEILRWAAGKSVQTSLHEYGGGALHALKNGVIFATNDGLYHQKVQNEEPELILSTNEGKNRFGDCSSTSTHIFAVNENHETARKFPENRLISIDKQTKEVKIIASGADFYAYPRISPNGKRMVWMQWNHPNMPWDETSICLADIDENGQSSNQKILRSGEGKKINYTEPSWLTDSKILFVNDSTNFWNVYELDVESENGSETEKNLLKIDQEIGYPLWQLGFRNYAQSANILALNVNGEIQIIRRQNQSITTVPTAGYTVFSNLSINSDDELFAIASGPKKASSLISIDLRGGDTNFPIRIHRESRDSSEIDQLEISEPELFRFVSDGIEVSGHFYPPTNSNYSPPKSGQLPPVLLMGHGGPTAPAQTSLDLKKQFFTSRGIAVFDVNYRGSTGFGSEFRRMLYKNYGIVDRNDILNGARALIENGKVDAEKVIMTGSSSGGFLILSCLISPDNIIKAAASLYGVADLLALDEDTHKFEQSYNELLVGKMPEEAQIYSQRNPINHISKISTPIAFLHGKEDTVVPVEQSIEMFEKIRKNGIMTALELYDGEGHGFRSGKVIRESTEAVFYFLMKAIGIDPGYESQLKIVNPRE
ncbi:unnamed protein product [Caenorhabditis angaria]|uniref:Peptidase S9 prolyl oligopeptidase catalytic domain-containing protein n=1 Tax=Caenorhabditis angaria TaxID=860376 RepID=A0A9P1IHI3_9PELO|nr:unnamed protein product [Caenorhabditis angaria]